MKERLTDKLLLFISRLIDLNIKLRNWQEALLLLDNPQLGYHRRWVIRYLKDKKKRSQIYAALNNLNRRGYLQKKVFHKSVGYSLTLKGELKVLDAQVRLEKKKKLFSGDWILVFYDIPETMRRTRNIFRSKLIILGFEQLQKSVWACPFEVNDHLSKIINELGLDKYVKPLIVKKMIN